MTKSLPIAEDNRLLLVRRPNRNAVASVEVGLQKTDKKSRTRVPGEQEVQNNALLTFEIYKNSILKNGIINAMVIMLETYFLKIKNRLFKVVYMKIVFNQVVNCAM